MQSFALAAAAARSPSAKSNELVATTSMETMSSSKATITGRLLAPRTDIHSFKLAVFHKADMPEPPSSVKLANKVLYLFALLVQFPGESDNSLS
mmetsp:Transcript_136207/g.236815  ORF Transcript_136207/g.236815 Transcript_136207/m.236815 type:complete len:94 (-) Transcript_136207:947-1228(-)